MIKFFISQFLLFTMLFIPAAWGISVDDYLNIGSHPLSKALFDRKIVDTYIQENVGKISNLNPRWYIGTCKTESFELHLGVFRIGRDASTVKDFILIFDRNLSPKLTWELKSDLRQYFMNGCKLMRYERGRTLGDSNESFSKVKRELLVDFSESSEEASVKFEGEVYKMPKF